MNTTIKKRTARLAFLSLLVESLKKEQVPFRLKRHTRLVSDGEGTFHLGPDSAILIEVCGIAIAGFHNDLIVFDDSSELDDIEDYQDSINQVHEISWENPSREEDPQGNILRSVSAYINSDADCIRDEILSQALLIRDARRLSSWKDLTSDQKEDAVEKIQASGKYSYPDWDDVSFLTEDLEEFLTNVLGFELHQGSRSINWQADGQGRGVGFDADLRSDFAKQLPAEKEISLDSDYGRKTFGREIIAKQEALQTAIRTFEQVLVNQGNSYTDLTLRTKRPTCYGGEFITRADADIDWHIDLETEGENEYEEAARVEREADLERLIQVAADSLEEVFEDYVRFSAGLLLERLDAEIDYRNSEEFLLEEGEAGCFDHLEFVLEGNQVVDVE